MSHLVLLVELLGSSKKVDVQAVGDSWAEKYLLNPEVGQTIGSRLVPALSGRRYRSLIGRQGQTEIHA